MHSFRLLFPRFLHTNIVGERIIRRLESPDISELERSVFYRSGKFKFLRNEPVFLPFRQNLFRGIELVGCG